MKIFLAFSSLIAVTNFAHAEIPNFPSTLCSISYGGTPQSPKSEFTGNQGLVGSDDNYTLQVLFSYTSAEVRVTDKKSGQVLIMEPATSELGTFKSPIGIVFTATGKRVFFNCANLKVQPEQ